MSRGRKSVTDGPLPAGLGWRVLMISCLVLLGGCLGERGLENDPLTGGPPIPPPASTPGPRPAERPAEAMLPPLPAPYSATSPAALTVGGPQPADPAQPRGAAPAVAEGPWKAPQAGAVLRQPEPADDSPSRLSPVPVPTPSFTLTAGAGGDTYEQLQDLLAARGVTWQRLETWGESGDWKFSCSIPNRQNPSIHRHYEARAPGGRGLPAMRAVLEQIDRESVGQGQTGP
jgi:hypothetical protein